MDLEGARREAGVEGNEVSRPSRTGLLELLFRFRYGLHLTIYVAAFAISWASARAFSAQRLWLTIPEAMTRTAGVDLQNGILAVTALAVALSFLAAMLRTWGGAFLSARVVADSRLRGTELRTAGPYRYVRHPLYLGIVLHTLALCVLMSWEGALFALVAVGLLDAALIVTEERFLVRELPETYRRYREHVRAFLPRLPPLLPKVSAKGDWGWAALGEIYMWGAAISFAAFGWSYNSLLILQGLLVSLGAAIAVRGLMGKR